MVMMVETEALIKEEEGGSVFYKSRRVDLLTRTRFEAMMQSGLLSPASDPFIVMFQQQERSSLTRDI